MTIETNVTNPELILDHISLFEFVDMSLAFFVLLLLVKMLLFRIRDREKLEPKAVDLDFSASD